jgi:SH3-like domain-containing protein
MTLARQSTRTLLVFAALAGAAVPAFAAGEVANGSASGLPLPRFVSLKSDKVNVRGGPTKDHDVTWVYTRAGLPVEITAEFENWRRIRDWEGAEGWVYHSLLSGRRTAVVTAKAKEDLIPVCEKPDSQSPVVAKLQAGVSGAVKRCTGNWCRVIGQGFDGWVEQDRLWGVYPDEKVD